MRSCLGADGRRAARHVFRGGQVTLQDRVLGPGLEQFGIVGLGFQRKVQLLRVCRQAIRCTQVAEVLHLPDGPEADARNAQMATTDFFEDKLAWIHGYDPTVDSGIRPGALRV